MVCFVRVFYLFVLLGIDWVSQLGRQGPRRRQWLCCLGFVWYVVGLVYFSILCVFVCVFFSCFRLVGLLVVWFRLVSIFVVFFRLF